ncbi:MAG: methylthioribulose 1-phosphate dehydratase [Flavobacteriia bacterium]
MEIKSELAAVIRAFNAKGWSPATSTNYSYKEGKGIFVSRSGIDKSQFTEQDFIEVDSNGKAVDIAIKPSAETLIHCVLYDLFPQTGVILHAHSVYSVLNSQKYDSEIIFEGYEIQKGFRGQTTHLNQVSIPIIENSQDMMEFSKWMRERKNEFENHCFIIKNHGVYAWGENLFEAKRHMETLEYLLEINWKLNH